MAEEEKPTGQEVDGDKGANPDPKTPVGSEKPELSSEEQSRREEQSKRDREQATDKGGNNRDEDLDFLMAQEATRSRDSYIGTFLGENAEKYPHVTADDLKFATSKEEVEQLATHLENRYKGMEQDALTNVTDNSEKELTEQEIIEAEKELEKQQETGGGSRFGSFLDLAARRKR